MLMTGVEAARLSHATVVEVTESGVLARLDNSVGGIIDADVLVTTEATPVVFAPGDRVLVWLPAAGARPVVLGRVGAPAGGEATPDAPDSLTIEAKRSLTLRAGQGSITIREDGKILIKGKDLVSHAQRLNRIKGGAVAIN
jgi:hypothetical protein